MGTQVETTAGIVEGARRDGVLHFAGIPYAAPASGDRRFRPPEPHEGWTGIRRAVEAAPVSPQVDLMAQLVGAEPEPTDEDCLHLNVFTPGADDARRPVMVWVHGGAFVMGSGSGPGYDGSVLASRGDVVVVTLNYRLGALGFLHLGAVDDRYPDAGNVGIHDQIAALAWVRDNIEVFGGDPGNVTVFGESAGGMSVGTLLAAPAARGLFHKAILQSGAAHNASPPGHAAEIAERFLATAGATSVDELLERPADQLIEAQQALVLPFFGDTEAQMASGGRTRLPFQPVADGRLLPETPIDALAGGGGPEVPVLVGTNLDEWRLFQFLDTTELDEDGLERRLAKALGDGGAAAEVYREACPDLDPRGRFGAAVTDLVFRQPAIRLAEAAVAAGTPVWSYLFTWASPAMGGVMGSCHALDVPFVFGRLDAPGLAMLVGDDPPWRLVDVVQESWLAFARAGDPANEVVGDWPRYDLDRRATLEVNVEPTVLEDPESERRRLWEGVV